MNPNCVKAMSLCETMPSSFSFEARLARKWRLRTAYSDFHDLQLDTNYFSRHLLQIWIISVMATDSS